jgi:glycosyltransferase involved in cell wall biosynthesis
VGTTDGSRKWGDSVVAVTFITEPLLYPEFVQFENIIEVLTKLARKYEISVASPRLSPRVQRELESRGIRPLSGDHTYSRPRHNRDEIPSYAISWAGESIFRLNGRTMEKLLAGRSDFVVNASMTTAYPSDIWYAQSPPLGLEAMSKSVDGWLSLAFTVGRRPVELIDSHHLRRCSELASRIYSTTHWVGQYYRRRGMPFRGVVPNYYHSDLSPSTPTPSRDYLLGYLGKETDSSALKMIMESGMPVKLFGSKSPGFVRKLTSRQLPANVQVLGPVSWAELRDLYSNAAFTVFPFTDEPFGLVPLESMACGTPVLTYGMQGPGETVIHGRTGWLVSSPKEVLQEARRLFQDGYPAWISAACVERAARYSVDRISRTWEDLIHAALNGEPDPPSVEPLDPRGGSFVTSQEMPSPNMAGQECLPAFAADRRGPDHPTESDSSFPASMVLGTEGARIAIPPGESTDPSSSTSYRARRTGLPVTAERPSTSAEYGEVESG